MRGWSAITAKRARVVALAASAVIFGERLSYEPLVGVLLVLASICGIGRAPGASHLPDDGRAKPD